MSIRRSNTTATAATAATARTTGTVETSATSLSENDLPEGTTAHLLVERLRAWKHACGYLEDYCESMEKMQKKHASEMEKVAKTVENELRERPQFDDSPNGFAALFRTLHDNTQNVANLHLETERQLRTVVRPILSNLHSDIKAKSKETNDASAKTFKKVEKTRQETQKVLEALGTQSSHFEVSTDKPSTSNDPLIIDRHVQHKFNKQINEENNNLNELKATQERMRQYEVRTVEMLQQAFGRLNETMAAQADGIKNMYAQVAQFAANIPPEFEWAAFSERNGSQLVNPDTPPRTMKNLTYPGQDHPTVNPLVAGHLSRKSRAMLKGWQEGYWAISRLGYMHGFKDMDPVIHDWEPDMSLYLPECTLTKTDGMKFDLKGKNHAGSMTAAAMSFENHFKCMSPSEAQKWIGVIEEFINQGRRPVGIPGMQDGSMAAGAEGAQEMQQGQPQMQNHAQQPMSPQMQGQTMGQAQAQSQGMSQQNEMQTQNLPMHGSNPASPASPSSPGTPGSANMYGSFGFAPGANNVYNPPRGNGEQGGMTTGVTGGQST